MSYETRKFLCAPELSAQALNINNDINVICDYTLGWLCIFWFHWCPFVIRANGIIYTSLTAMEVYILKIV